MRKSKAWLGSILLMVCTSMTLMSCSTEDVSTEPIVHVKGTEISADDAINHLKDGNKLYVNGDLTTKADISAERREDLFKNGQYPYAVILSCSDSRVPTEEVFGEGLGSIFVVRNAGNVVDDISLGSIEYGAEHLGSPLIVVMGHQNCGAVKATVEGGEVSENIQSIIDLIKPSYEIAKKEGSTTEVEALCAKTEDENIKNSINAIKESEVIDHLIKENKVKVVGAKYSQETGEVTFLE